MATAVIVRGLAAEDAKAVRNHFADCCADPAALQCTLLYQRRKNKAPVFLHKARLEFPDAVSARKAVAKSDSSLAGRTLRVEPDTTVAREVGSTPSTKAEKRRQRLESERQHRSVFLGGLPEDVTELTVQEALQRCGRVDSLRLVPPADGVAGFCIATMQKVKGARRALELHTLKVADHDVRVEAVRLAKDLDEQYNLQSAAECFLRNVPSGAPEAAVRSSLQRFGFVASVRFLERDGQRTGLAVVEFERSSAAAQAVEAGKTYIMGRPVLIDFSKSKLTRGNQRDAAREFAGVTRVLAGGLADNVTEADMRALFGRCGLVDNVLFLDTRDPNGARQALLEFRMSASVAAAVEMTGLQWRGRPLFVEALRDTTAPTRDGERRPPQPDATSPPTKHREAGRHPLQHPPPPPEKGSAVRQADRTAHQEARKEKPRKADVEGVGGEARSKERKRERQWEQSDGDQEADRAAAAQKRPRRSRESPAEAEAEAEAMEVGDEGAPAAKEARRKKHRKRQPEGAKAGEA